MLTCGKGNSGILIAHEDEQIALIDVRLGKFLLIVDPGDDLLQRCLWTAAAG